MSGRRYSDNTGRASIVEGKTLSERQKTKDFKDPIHIYWSQIISLSKFQTEKLFHLSSLPKSQSSYLHTHDARHSLGITITRTRSSSVDTETAVALLEQIPELPIEEALDHFSPTAKDRLPSYSLAGETCSR